MEVGVASYSNGRAGSPATRSSPATSGVRSSPRGNLHVEFAPTGEMKERKEKYLTAKYGAHQMSLIRKRLGVEMWMYDQLQALYQTTKKDGKNEEKEIDLDELLDMEEDLSKRKFLHKHLSDCKESPDKIDKFITDLLQRAKTL